MSGYAYTTPVPSAPPATGGGYVLYASAVTEQILQTEPEKLASGYVAYEAANAEAAAPASMSAYIPYKSGDGDEIASAYMAMDGENKNGDARAAAVVQQAALLELSTQHGQAPVWEKADPSHRMGELLLAAWAIYQSKPGMRGPKQGDFFRWLDAIPEWERVVMISQKVREMGTTVLGTPEQRKLLKWENAHLNAAGVKNELNLRPSIVKAFVQGVKYLDAASRPSYVVSFAGDRAMYRGAPFDTSMMKTVFSGRGYAIWVMGGDGTIYAGNHVYGQMHHSSFLSGGAILAGGEIRAKSGKIDFVSGKSGHYCPPIDSLIEALRRLEMLGVNIGTVRVLVWGTAAAGTNGPLVVTGSQVVQNGKRLYLAWGMFTPRQKALMEAGRFEEFK